MSWKVFCLTLVSRRVSEGLWLILVYSFDKIFTSSHLNVEEEMCLPHICICESFKIDTNFKLLMRSLEIFCFLKCIVLKFLVFPENLCIYSYLICCHTFVHRLLTLFKISVILLVMTVLSFLILIIWVLFFFCSVYLDNCRFSWSFQSTKFWS